MIVLKILVAVDSFKGSLTTFEAGEAIVRGVKRAHPLAEVEISPIADGGEGTVDAIVSATGGERVTVRVTGPLGETVDATYGIVRGDTAVMEMSAAAGITLVAPEARDPMKATTYGVGEMMLDALSRGVKRFILGIGGSATNDGGVGMLQALGVRFLNRAGNDIGWGAAALAGLASISLEGLAPTLAACEILVACDVKNPLCGERGCSAVYGPQKGATPETVLEMDGYLSRYAALTRAVLPNADPNLEGAGAAGGLGFALQAYLGATLTGGISLVMRETGLEERIKCADVVVTGEGRLDGQTGMGKAPVGVAALAKKYGKTVIAFAGCVTPDARLCNECGIDAFFPILRAPCTLAEAMDKTNAAGNLADTAEQVFRLLK